MLTDTEPRKRGPKPRDWVRLDVLITPELNEVLDKVVLSSGVAKAALVRDALARYGEALGYLPKGSADLITPTRTSGPGISPIRKEQQ